MREKLHESTMLIKGTVSREYLQTHERTAQNLILSVRSSLFFSLGSLKSEEGLRDFKERCAQLWYFMSSRQCVHSVDEQFD